VEDLRRLRYFVTLVRHRHFGAAAAELHITQPALSQQIKKLERELSAPLVDRASQGFALTSAGEYLSREAPGLLRAMDEAADAVRDHTVGTRGEIRIAYTRSGSDAGIVQRIRRFREDRPNVRITSITGWTSWNLELLRAGEVDVGFVRGDLTAPDLGLIQCGSVEVAVVVPRTHPLAGKSEVHKEEILDEPIVFWPREAGPEMYDDTIRSIWIDGAPRIVSEETDAEQVIEQVARGVGISVLERARATRIAPEGAVVLPLVDPPLVAMSLAWRRDDPSPAVRELIRWWRSAGADSLTSETE
jgi:DNA-binding transcriptional LysR family regulator